MVGGAGSCGIGGSSGGLLHNEGSSNRKLNGELVDGRQAFVQVALLLVFLA
jgi:hypothetical protein